jgi:tetratricopeptide (TPR) repeat protein
MEYLERFPRIDQQQTYVVRHRLAELWQQYPNATRLFSEAADADPRRAEPWVSLARIARHDRLYQVAALYMQQAKSKRVPTENALFVDFRYYHEHDLGWIAREEDALALFYTDRVAEARDIWKRLLMTRDLPEDIRSRVADNIKRF